MHKLWKRICDAIRREMSKTTEHVAFGVPRKPETLASITFAKGVSKVEIISGPNAAITVTRYTLSEAGRKALSGG